MTTFKEYKSYDATGLAELVRRREVSSPELIEVAISEIEKTNPRLNAIVCKMYDEARKQAQQPTPGAFSGVPFLIKDLSVERKGFATTGSSAYFADDVARTNCELMNRFDALGFIPLGKTNTPELGIYGITESALRGPCLNPWNLAHTPGGSSGGSAAAVASRMVPAAHGDDGGGSIRIPASACGLVGLKPSRGRVPFGPHKLESWGGFASPHVLTRTVRDSAAILDGIHGPEPGSPYHPPGPQTTFLDSLSRAPKKLRIAFNTDAMLSGTTHPDCKKAVEEAASLCQSLGHTVEEAQPTLDKHALREAYFVTVSCAVALELRLASERLKRPLRRKDFELETWFMYVLGSHFLASELSLATFRIRQLAQTLENFLQTYDLWLTPTLATPPSPIGDMKLGLLDRLGAEIFTKFPVRSLLLKVVDQLGQDALSRTPNTQVFNMSGLPAMSLPVTMSPSGLPIGVQFASRYGSEEVLLNLAQQLEDSLQWQNRVPPLCNF